MSNQEVYLSNSEGEEEQLNALFESVDSELDSSIEELVQIQLKRDPNSPSRDGGSSQPNKKAALPVDGSIAATTSAAEKDALKKMLASKIRAADSGGSAAKPPPGESGAGKKAMQQQETSARGAAAKKSATPSPAKQRAFRGELTTVSGNQEPSKKFTRAKEKEATFLNEQDFTIEIYELAYQFATNFGYWASGQDHDALEKFSTTIWPIGRALQYLTDPLCRFGKRCPRPPNTDGVKVCSFRKYYPKFTNLMILSRDELATDFDYDTLFKDNLVKGSELEKRYNENFTAERYKQIVALMVNPEGARAEAERIKADLTLLRDNITNCLRFVDHLIKKSEDLLLAEKARRGRYYPNTGEFEASSEYLQGLSSINVFAKSARDLLRAYNFIVTTELPQ